MKRRASAGWTVVGRSEAASRVWRIWRIGLALMFAIPLSLLAASVPPALTCSSNLTVECLGTNGVTVTYSVETHSPASRCEPPSGSLFLPGATVVRCIAWDSFGETNTCKFVVTVIDVSQPQLDGAETVVVPTDPAGCGAKGVSLASPQARNFDGPVTLTNDAPVEFPKGTNIVTWVAFDSLSNRASCQQVVIVRDQQPPQIVLPPLMTLSASTGRKSISRTNLVAPLVTDNCGNVQSTNDAANELEIGMHRIRWTAVDEDGNTTSADQEIVVTDTQPPTIECPQDIVVTTENGREYVTALPLGTPVARDNQAVLAITNDVTAVYGPGDDWWWVDPLNGDDADAQRGDPQRAFQTLSAALAAAVDGDTVVMKPGTNFIRCALLDEGTPELFITRSNLTILGQPGATLVATNLGDGILCVGAANLKIRGLTMIGFRTNDNAVPFDLWSGIHIMGGCEGTEIAYNRLDNWMDQGIAVLNEDPSTSTNVWVHHNYITRCGFVWRTSNGFPFNRFDGAAIVPDAGWLVESNRVEDCAMSIEIYPPLNLGFRAPPSIVRDNVLKNNLVGIIAGNNLCPVVVTGNTVVNDTNYTWVVDNRYSPWVGIGELEAWYPFGVLFQGSGDGLVISSNTIKGWRIGIGAIDGSVTNSVFDGNLISETWQAGILVGEATYRVAMSRNVSITGNIITNASSCWSGYGAISVYATSDAVIAGNSISGDYFEGVSIYCLPSAIASNVVVRDTWLEGSFTWGVFVWDDTTGVEISRTAADSATFSWGKYYVVPAVTVIEGDPASPPPVPPTTPSIDGGWAFPSWDAQMEDDLLARFPLGTNLVQWTAIDASGNTASCHQKVIVLAAAPAPPPCPADMTVTVANNCETVVNYPLPAVAADTVVTCLPAPGSVLPAGSTTVHCWMIDSTGRSNECTFRITVSDAPPVISLQRAPVQNGFTLSWPVTCTEWILEAAPEAGGACEWTPVEATLTTTDGVRRVFLPADSGQRFFRLRLP